MAKVTLTLEDAFKDGKPVIEGRFTTEGIAPPPVPGAQVSFTPSQLFAETVKRLWDDGVINLAVRRYVPDMLYHNNMLAKQAAAAALPKAPAPAGAVEDAEVLAVAAPVKNNDNAPVVAVPDALGGE